MPKKFGREQTEIRITNKDFANFLKENDYLIKSGASPNKILSLIPNNFHQYWYRGYMDGDGTYSTNGTKFLNLFRIGASSTYDQNWNFMELLSNELVIKNYITKGHYKNGSGSVWRINRQKDILKFINFIYTDRFDIRF
ncbi:MAG: LAGLIDADG family homing endonuclease [Patescibacteria group bacterium]